MDRRQQQIRRIQRLLKDSQLPLEKDLASFDLKRLPAKVAKTVRVLLDGGFIERREKVLAFGTAGAGKTHVLCAVAQELIRSQAETLRPSLFLFPHQSHTRTDSRVELFREK